MDSDILRLCDEIREAAFQLHSHLKHGHLEKVYENGMAHRLIQKGIKVCLEQQFEMNKQPIEPLALFCG